MTFTGRFLLIALLAPPVVGLAGGWSPSVLAGVNAVLAAAAALDYLLNRPGRSLKARRHFNPRFSLHTEARVELAVTNKSARPLTVVLRELIAPDLGGTTFKSRVELAPGATSRVGYDLLPSRRGEQPLGPLAVRITGPLGLTTRQAIVAGAEMVRVYPNVTDLARYDLSLRRGIATEVGLHNSSRRGLGTEFESIREYVPDDEWRRINWRATSRRAKPFTNLYTDDRCQTVMIAIDAGRLMYDRGQDAKLDSVVRAALMLSYVALSKDDRVGLVVFDDVLRTFVVPGKGRGQLAHIMDALYSLKGSLSESDYRQTMAPIINYKRRSLVVLFTDVVETISESLLASVTELRRRHLVLSLFVGDSAAPATATAVPHASPDVFRQATAIQLLADRERAIAGMKQAGAMVQDVQPEKLTPALIDKYIDIKQRALL